MRTFRGQRRYTVKLTHSFTYSFVAAPKSRKLNLRKKMFFTFPIEFHLWENFLLIPNLLWYFLCVSGVSPCVCVWVGNSFHTQSHSGLTYSIRYTGPLKSCEVAVQKLPRDQWQKYHRNLWYIPPCHVIKVLHVSLPLTPIDKHCSSKQNPFYFFFFFFAICISEGTKFCDNSYSWESTKEDKLAMTYTYVSVPDCVGGGFWVCVGVSVCICACICVRVPEVSVSVSACCFVTKS